MNRLTTIFLIFAATLTLSCCQQDLDAPVPTEGKGTLVLTLTDAQLYTELQTRSSWCSTASPQGNTTRAEAPVTDLSKYVFTLNGTTIGGATVTDLVLDVSADGTAEVNAGTYTLTADNQVEANRNSGRPWYNGTSEPFTITLNASTPVSIALGKPKNARIMMAVDASFTALYDSPVLTLSDGTRSLTLTSTDEACYFVIPASGALAYSITADAKADSHVTDMHPATGYVEIQAGYNTTITLKAHPATGIIIPVTSGEYSGTFD